MRDDLFGLGSMRMFSGGRSPTPSTGMPRLPAAGPSSFATELKRANTARAATAQFHRHYTSPLARPTLNGQAAAVRRALAPTRAPSIATPTTLSRPPSTIDRSSPTAPVASLAAPDPPKALDPTLLPGAMMLAAYPQPNGDNGRGMHWIPTTEQSPSAIDRFVAEAQRMGVKWVTFLNDGADASKNDYLVTKLVGVGIEPVMRLFSPTIAPIQGDVESMVRHYSSMGVHYFQPFNEPNLNAETADGKASVDHYLDAWIPVAQAIVRGGGLPGFGSMAPGGDLDDQQFLTAALDGLKNRGQLGVLDKAWLSMHNYTWNHPIQDRGDGDGFFKFRAYHTIVQAALGRDLPIIGTEGGTFTGEQEDQRMAPVTPGMAADWTHQAFSYMRDQREPWMFASSVWTIADLAGGGSDPRFEAQALFKADGTQNSIVGALQSLANSSG